MKDDPVKEIKEIAKNMEPSIIKKDSIITRESESSDNGKETSKKAKRGRPKGTTKKAKIEQEQLIDLTQLIDVFFNQILAARNQNWALSDQEKNLLAFTGNKFIEKRFPTLINNSVELAFYSAIGTIILPRFIAIVQPQNLLKKMFSGIKRFFKGEK
ncbi:MAG: hypothetical protein ACW972_02080 [Promethearchaeota archaeon]|jgi:hypothetical protein